jgi:hypothetical protein
MFDLLLGLLNFLFPSLKLSKAMRRIKAILSSTMATCILLCSLFGYSHASEATGSVDRITGITFSSLRAQNREQQGASVPRTVSSSLRTSWVGTLSVVASARGPQYSFDYDDDESSHLFDVNMSRIANPPRYTVHGRLTVRVLRFILLVRSHFAVTG